MKKRYILLGTLLLLPTMVNAESLTTTIKCDPIKFGQTANCKIIGTTNDYVSSVEYVLNTTDNLEVQSFNIPTAWQGNETSGRVYLYSNLTYKGNLNLGTFTVKATGLGKASIDVTNLIPYDSEGIQTDGVGVTLSTDIEDPNYGIYTYSVLEYNTSTKMYKLQIFKNDQVYSGTDQSVFIKDLSDTSLSASTNGIFIVPQSFFEPGDPVEIYFPNTKTRYDLQFEDDYIPEYTITSSNRVNVIELQHAKSNMGHEIYRSEDGVNFGQIKRLEPGVVRTEDTTAKNGKTYYYRIRTYKTENGVTKYSDYSKVKSFLRLDPPQFQVKRKEIGTATVSLTKIDTAAKYIIYINNLTTKEVVELETTELENDITVEAGNKYSITAKVVLKDGKISDESNAITYTEEVAKPVSATLTAVTSKTTAPRIKITIGAPTDKVDGYIIRRNGVKVADITTNTYITDYLKYGSYSYTVTSYVCLDEDCKEKLESAAIGTNTIILKSTVPTITVTRNGRFDQNKIVISKPVGVKVGTNTLTYYIYRSTNNKTYTLIKTITNASLTSSYSYTDTISGAVVNTYYYYKVVAKTDTSSQTTAIKYIKSTVTAPTITLNNTTNAKQTLKINTQGVGIKYQIYRATSKKGKYTKVYDGTGLTYNKTTSWNKTYYYKVRAYYKVKGKTVYTAYSTILGRKMTFTTLNKFPLTYRVNGTTDIIKSISLTRKSTSSSSKYYMTIKHTKTISSKSQTVIYKMKVYNFDKTKSKIINVKVPLVKGKKGSTSKTITVYIPNWATIYYFL